MEVLATIRTSIVRRGHPPTLREIGGALGLRSTNGVNDHIKSLIKKGLLTRDSAKSRGLKLTPPGEAALVERGLAVKLAQVDLVEVPIFSNLVPGCEAQEEPLRLSKNLLHGARDPFGYRLCSGGGGFLAGDVLLAGEVEDPRRVRPVIAVVGDVALACQMSTNYVDKAVYFHPLVGGAPVYVALNAFDPSAILGTVVALWRTAG